MPLIILLFVVFNLITLRYPVFSFMEIVQMPEFMHGLADPKFFWLFRIVPLFAITLTLWYMVNKFNRRITGFLIVAFMPWLFMLSKEFNLWVDGFLVLIILSLTAKKYTRFINIIFGLFMVVFISANTTSLSSLSVRIANWQKDFTLLAFFFQAENASQYARIPRVGYFNILLLPFFVLGLYSVIKNHRWPIYIRLSAVSTLFYLFYPTHHFIFAGVGFLFIISLIIIDALNKVLTNRLYTTMFVICYLLFSVFFLEMYFRHYQIKSGYERNYAKLKLVMKLSQLTGNQILTTSEFKRDSDLHKVIKAYGRLYRFPEITYIPEDDWPSQLAQCDLDKTVCLFNETRIRELGFAYDDPRFTVVNEADGGKIYFLR